MTDPLEHLGRPGVQPRLFVLAVVLALILAAASLWWLTGPAVQLTHQTITPAKSQEAGETHPPPPTGPSRH